MCGEGGGVPALYVCGGGGGEGGCSIVGYFRVCAYFDMQQTATCTFPQLSEVSMSQSLLR